MCGGGGGGGSIQIELVPVSFLPSGFHLVF